MQDNKHYISLTVCPFIIVCPPSCCKDFFSYSKEIFSVFSDTRDCQLLSSLYVLTSRRDGTLEACDVSEAAFTLSASKQTHGVLRILLTKKHRWLVVFFRNPEAAKLLLYFLSNRENPVLHLKILLHKL